MNHFFIRFLFVAVSAVAVASTPSYSMKRGSDLIESTDTRTTKSLRSAAVPFEAPDEIHTERVVLRPFDPNEDTDYYYALEETSHISKDCFITPSHAGMLEDMGFFAVNTPFTQYNAFLKKEDGQQFIGSFRLDFPKRSLKEKEEGLADKEMMEILKLYEGERLKRSTSYSLLLEEFRGKGLGTEIKKAILEKIIQPMLGRPVIIPVYGAGFCFEKCIWEGPFEGLEIHVAKSNCPSLCANLKVGCAITKRVEKTLYLTYPPEAPLDKKTVSEILSESKRLFGELKSAD